MEGVPSGVVYLACLFPHMGAAKHSCYFLELFLKVNFREFTLRDCPKSPGRAHSVALWAAKEVLFAPFWPPCSSQIDGWSVAHTPFRTVSARASEM